MQASEMTFGCEFEVTLPAANCPTAGNYHQGIQIPGLPTGWNAQRDASIQCTVHGHVGVEIVSPVLKGVEGLRQVQLVCKWLQENGARVNKSTGFHVHVGCRREEGLLGKVAFLVANFEKALYAATGTKNRERGSYCRPIQNDTRYQQRFVSGQRASTDRYHSLNLTNLDLGRKPTVEFRVFAGTTNAIKAIGYIRLCLAVVEKAHATKRKPKWVAKTPVASSPITRGGEGQTCLNRLFYTLGWTKGREDRVFGEVVADDLPSIQTCKQELMRLASKYDAS